MLTVARGGREESSTVEREGEGNSDRRTFRLMVVATEEAADCHVFSWNYLSCEAPLRYLSAKG